MKKRIITAIVMAIIFVPLVILSGWYYTALVMFLSYIAGYELLNMMGKEVPQFKKLKYIAPFFNVLTILAAAINTNLILPIVVIVCLLYLSLGIINTKFNIRSSMKLIFSYAYSGLCLTYVYLLRNPFSDGYFNSGFYVFIYLILAVIFTDIGAYSVGCSIGKHKLCPEISPKKTIEGSIGGMIIGMVISIAYYFVLSKKILNYSVLGFSNDLKLVWEIILVILISFFLTIATQIGDLVASKVKREYNIKDFSNIFPGHGGVLDRFDSTIFAGALFHAILTLLI